MNATGFASDYERRLCSKYAGLYFDQMLQSLDATWRFLTHTDPSVRLGALAMLRDYWKAKGEFPIVCEKMALGDSDFDVRCLALNCLITFYFGTRDNRMCRWLAHIIKDESQDVRFRKLAYCVLAYVETGLPYPLPETVSFPEEVNWNMIEKYDTDPGP